MTLTVKLDQDKVEMALYQTWQKISLEVIMQKEKD